MINSSQFFKRAKELASPRSKITVVCVPDDERSYSCQDKLRTHIGTQVG
jgi:hypothetical protein